MIACDECDCRERGVDPACWPAHGPRVWSCQEGECRRCELEQERDERIREADGVE